MKKQEIISKLEVNVYRCFCCESYCTDDYAMRGKHSSGGQGKIADRYICKSCYDLLHGIEKGELRTIKKSMHNQSSTPQTHLKCTTDCEKCQKEEK